jgi:NAD(P)-dependent dehydrogenase (short-subunit alcohol dehydrogenase family)
MIVLVTGCNTGLGLHCVRALASRDAAPPAAILLACRSPAAASAAEDAIAASSAYPRASLVVLPQPLDLASLASVRAYAAAVSAWLAGRRLAALVNNAGVGGSSALRLTGDGYESILQTNHLGHFLLTLLLLPCVAGGRIINVSSEVHDAAANALPMPEPSAWWPPTADSPEWERAVARGGRRAAAV